MRRVLVRFVSLLVFMICLGGPLQAAGELVIIDLPRTSAFESVVTAADDILQGEGYDTWRLGVHDARDRTRDAATIACESGASLQKELGTPLDDYVRKGGGLVCVVSEASGQQEQTRQLLDRFGVKLEPIAKLSADLTITSHDITHNIVSLSATPVKQQLHGDGFETLIEQGGAPVALCGVVGKGRLVLLSAPLLYLRNTKALEPAKVRLLAQAVKWAAVPAPAIPGAGKAVGPGTPSTVMPVAATFSATAVVDLGDETSGTDLSALVEDNLHMLGLARDRSAPRKGPQTLATVLAQRPAVVILGSYRDFSETETAQLVQYVETGGSLLVFPSGSQSTISKLVALNRVLGEFGIAVTGGRNAGTATMMAHPITEGLKVPDKAPEGCAIWALADWPLVQVGDAALASAHEFGQGRIVVLDSATLLRPDPKSKVEDTSSAYRTVLLSALRWLTGRSPQGTH